MGVVRAASEDGKCIKVVATETRPALQGARLTAFELREDGFDVTVIADTMVGHVMKNGWVDKVLLGADRIMGSGHIFNKIGTYQIAVLAKAHRIPFHPVAPSSTFDLINKWRDVVIEERHADEITKIRGRRILPKGVNVFNPAFDMTPPEFVTSLVTDRGILKPPYEQSIRKDIKPQMM